MYKKVAIIAILVCLLLVCSALVDAKKESLREEVKRLVALKKQLRSKWNPNKYLSGRILKIAKKFRISLPRRCKRRIVIDTETVETIRKLAQCDKDSRPVEPKPETPKPKPEEPKPSQPEKPRRPRKPVEPKPETPKPEEPKPETPKPSEPKPEEPKPTQPSQPTTPVERPRRPRKPRHPRRPVVVPRRPRVPGVIIPRRPRVPRRPVVIPRRPVVVPRRPAAPRRRRGGFVRRVVRAVRSFGRRGGRGRGDPHYKLLTTGKDILFNGLGDYVLAKTRDGQFTSHVRIARFGGKKGVEATVNRAVAARIGEDVVEFNARTRKFYLNRKRASFKVGKVYNLDGGHVLRKTKKSFIVKSDNGAELFAELFVLHDGRAYLDVQVEAPKNVKFSSGLIVDGKVRGKAKGLFRTYKKQRSIPKTKLVIPQWAVRACAKKGLKGNALKDCEYDATVTGRSFAREIAGNEKKFDKRADKLMKKKKTN